ncbi:hypothetical protein PG984_005325 [Apiospora sp. TS-2023a]
MIHPTAPHQGMYFYIYGRLSKDERLAALSFLRRRPVETGRATTSSLRGILSILSCSLTTRFLHSTITAVAALTATTTGTTETTTETAVETSAIAARITETTTFRGLLNTAASRNSSSAGIGLRQALLLSCFGFRSPLRQPRRRDMEPAHIVIVILLQIVLELGVMATRLVLLIIFDDLVRRDVVLGRKAGTADHAAICGRQSVGVLGGGAVHVDRIQPRPHPMQRIISYSLGRVDDALVPLHLQLLKDDDLAPELGHLLLIRGEHPRLFAVLAISRLSLHRLSVHLLHDLRERIDFAHQLLALLLVRSGRGSLLVSMMMCALRCRQLVSMVVLTLASNGRSLVQVLPDGLPRGHRLFGVFGHLVSFVSYPIESDSF